MLLLYLGTTQIVGVRTGNWNVILAVKCLQIAIVEHMHGTMDAQGSVTVQGEKEKTEKKKKRKGEKVLKVGTGDEEEKEEEEGK